MKKENKKNRRDFIKLVGLSSAALYLPLNPFHSEFNSSVFQPPRLKIGDTVGVVSPAGPTFHKRDLIKVERSLLTLGLKVKFGKHVLSRNGYLAGSDGERADDFNAMIRDDGVKAVMAMRGGWGSNRILGLIDYDAVSQNPKIIIGFSDVTSLLLAIYANTGLITFYGPVATSKFGKFTSSWMKEILFEGKSPTLENPLLKSDGTINHNHFTRTINSGTARGKLIGGNLTVISSMIGSGYLPDWDDSILFLEEVGEKIYHIDRMLTQLKLAGVFEKLSGIVFGKCVKCDPSKTTLSLSLDNVFDEIFTPLKIPVYTGAMIGHIDRIFTIPIGLEAVVDADKGTIKLLEPAVL